MGLLLKSYRRSKFISTSFLLLLCLFSCQQSKKSLFHLGEGTALPVQFYENEIFAGEVLDMSLIDGKIVLHDVGRDYMMWFYDSADAALLDSFAARGRGPNEFLNPLFFSGYNRKDSSVYLYEPNAGKIYQYDEKVFFDHQKILSQFVHSRVLNVKKAPAYINASTVLDNGNFVFNVVAGEKALLPLLLMTPQGDIQQLGSVPDQKHLSPWTATFTGPVASYGNRFVFALNSLGYIVCYEQLPDASVKLCWEHYFEKPLYAENNNLSTSTLKSGFSDICMDGQYVYCAYSGQTTAEGGRYNQILVFDHEGRLQQHYSVEADIQHLLVSEDGKTLYAASNDSEVRLLKFTIVAPNK